MENGAALAEEAPLTLQGLPFWLLFIVVFALVTFVGSVLIAATNLLSSSNAPSMAGAAKHLLILPPAHS